MTASSALLVEIVPQDSLDISLPLRGLAQKPHENHQENEIRDDAQHGSHGVTTTR